MEHEFKLIPNHYRTTQVLKSVTDRRRKAQIYWFLSTQGKKYEVLQSLGTFSNKKWPGHHNLNVRMMRYMVIQIFHNLTDTVCITEHRPFFYLCRVVYPAMIANYVPLTLFTIASFSSFDIEANKGNDRIGFLITLFLVMVSMSVNITNRKEIVVFGRRTQSHIDFYTWDTRDTEKRIDASLTTRS